MTVQQLKHFLAVCEEMNYTRAAERCFISRQALRQSISKLETELKSTLFFNDANQICMTEAGELLQQRAVPVVKAFCELENDMLSGAGSRLINLGVSFSLVPDYLPRLDDYLRVFCERNPSFRVNVTHLKNDEITDAMLDGEIDCALQLDLGCCDERLMRLELSSHKSAILLSRKNPLSSRHSLTPADLKGQTLCLPGIGPAMRPLLDAVAANGDSTMLNVVESFYQVYYHVREENHTALNRFIPREGITDYVNNIVLQGIPPLCCAMLFPLGSENSDAERLGRFLQKEVRGFFGSLYTG